ncbi:MAG: polymerase subunit epsilon, partial [Nevskia sp.]|nr:polymerase subunit epsilon [Nevskia sp.]
SLGNRIIEIGCIELRNRRVVAEQRWYLNPDRDSEPGAFDVHGITREFLADKQRFPQIADELLKLLAGAELIIHNAAFDIGFLDYELERAGRTERIGALCSVLDTVSMARRLHPGQKANLDALCKRYNVDNTQRTQHGALLDARLLAEVYLAMTGGQSALGLESAAGSVGTTSAEAALAELFAGTPQPLTLIRASAAELDAHRERLTAIQKKSGALLWQGELPLSS